MCDVYLAIQLVINFLLRHKEVAVVVVFEATAFARAYRSSHFNGFIRYVTCRVAVCIAERLLAAQNPLSHADRPHQLFADAPPPGGPPAVPVPMMAPPPPPGQPTNIPPPIGGMIPTPMNVPPPSCMLLCCCVVFVMSVQFFLKLSKVAGLVQTHSR